MRIRFGSLLVGASLALGACHGGSPSLPSTSAYSQALAPDAAMTAFTTASTNVRIKHVCDAPKPGYRECFALRRTDLAPVHLSGLHAMALQNFGYGPSQLQAAYGIDTNRGSGVTVAIVDAFDDPTAESDLAQYRSAFGLPACTTANFCFRKASQTGTTTYPPADANWAGEISLDLDMVSAVCPKCNILLVEATNASDANLSAGVNYAATQPGVVAISNSYGGSEGGPGTNANYNHPGIVITASTGDNGYGAQDPAGYPSVVAVGGTRLQPSPTLRGWTDTAWSCASASACSNNGTGGSGSGCSITTAKPVWQTDTGCTAANNGGHGGRSIGDISAVADPASGVFVYETYGAPEAGFYVFGGTSAASPIIASMFAQAGNGPTITSANSSGAAKYVWQHHAGNVNDVISGANEPSQAGSCLTAWNYICKARVGYDGLTGWGTPIGYGAL